MKPIRVQMSRRKGFRLADAAGNGLPTVKVDRSTRWGNQFSIVAADDGWFEIKLDGSYRDAPIASLNSLRDARTSAVALFRHWAHGEFGYHFRLRVAAELQGCNLACWCPLPPPGQPDCCHAAVLLEIANAAALPPHDAGGRDETV